MDKEKIKKLYPNLTEEEVEFAYAKFRKVNIGQRYVLCFVFVMAYGAWLFIHNIQKPSFPTFLLATFFLAFIYAAMMIMGDDTYILLIYLFWTVLEIVCLFVLKMYDSDLPLYIVHICALVINIANVLRIVYERQEHRVVRDIIKNMPSSTKYQKPLVMDV